MQQLEQQLDSFNPEERKSALARLIDECNVGDRKPNQFSNYVNIHIHTFYGYNVYGHSPSKAAWLAHQKGLAVAGIIDFDVLDGLVEFFEAAKLLQLKGSVGIETRVFIPEYATTEINSPGEPGIAYHIGIGFPRVPPEKHLCDFMKRMQTTSQQRNIELISRVNKFLEPVVVDYDKDVLPLTPKANPTERHICQAYAIKAEKTFNDNETLAQFWSQKLSCSANSLDLPCGSKLLGEIRKKTMKKGTVGYVQPDVKSFPTMAEVNKFIIEAGGIPVLCWLDGICGAERNEEELLKVAMGHGVRAFSVIPNPAYTPNDPRKKLENLHKVVELVDGIGLPIVSGTEMNNAGQTIVDDFGSKDLSPLAPVFLKGAHIIYAHSVMQRAANLGYLSKWADQNFKSLADKNRFFERLGKVVTPANESKLFGLPSNTTPQEVMAILEVD